MHGGAAVPQPALLKIKSRGPSATVDPAAAYLQLYFGQTPKLFVGHHVGDGKFTSVSEHHLGSGEGFGAAAERVQPRLRKLQRVLAEIQGILRERAPQARLSLVCRKGSGTLQLMQGSEEGLFLPDAVLKRFDA